MLPLASYLNRDGWRKDWRETRERHPTLDVLLAKCTETYRTNGYINLNLNTILAAVPSIQAAKEAGNFASMHGLSQEAIPWISAAADWLTYIPIHIGLHYVSNKEKFECEDRTFSSRAFWQDTRKTYTTSIPSIALFYVAAGPLHYILMKPQSVFGENAPSGLEEGTAAQIAYWSVLLLTRAVHTYNAKRAGLFEKYHRE